MSLTALAAAARRGAPARARSAQARSSNSCRRSAQRAAAHSSRRLGAAPHAEVASDGCRPPALPVDRLRLPEALSKQGERRGFLNPLAGEVALELSLAKLRLHERLRAFPCIHAFDERGAQSAPGSRLHAPAPALHRSRQHGQPSFLQPSPPARHPRPLSRSQRSRRRPAPEAAARRVSSRLLKLRPQGRAKASASDVGLHRGGKEQ